jgi:disulfide bond formation protein DsbB
MSHRRVGLLAILAALAALGVAYFVQDVLHLVPCPLCLWERWPYRIVVMLGVLTILVRPTSARIVLALIVLAMLADAGIAFLHVGVEQLWWKSPLPECNVFFSANSPLPAAVAPPCDAPTYLFPHLPVSMAAMDLIYALAFAFALLPYVTRKPRRFK